jgi:putative DNA primase/helicase
MIKRLYAQPYPIQARIKTIIACNEMPHSKDATDGFFRRLLIVPFNNQFDEETRDVLIDQKLEKELSGIFNKALEGYKRLHLQKRFTISVQSTAIKNEYMEHTDLTRLWLDRVSIDFTENDSDFVSSEMIYQSYVNMCESHGEKPVTLNGFCMRLMVHKKQLKCRQGRKSMGGKKIRGYFKVRIFTGDLDGTTY